MTMDQLQEELLKLSVTERAELAEWIASSLEVQAAVERAWLDEDLSYNPKIGGQRRTLVEQYYHTVNWSDPGDIARVLSARGASFDSSWDLGRPSRKRGRF